MPLPGWPSEPFFSNNPTDEEIYWESIISDPKYNQIPYYLDEWQDKTAKKAQRIGAITLYDLSLIMAIDVPTAKLPALWDYSGLGENDNFKQWQDSMASTKRERAYVWYWLLCSWAIYDEYRGEYPAKSFFFSKIKEGSHVVWERPIQLLSLYEYENEQFRKVGTAKKQSPFQYIKLDEFKIYLKEIDGSIPLPTLLFPEKDESPSIPVKSAKYKPEQGNLEVPFKKPNDYMFKLDENHCEIVFNGKELPVIQLDGRLKLTGLKYIRYLISLYIKNDYEPADSVYPLELEEAVEGICVTKGPCQTNLKANYAVDVIGEKSNELHKMDYDNEVQEEKKRLKKAFQKLKNDLKEAQEDNDPGRIGKAQIELEKYYTIMEKEYSHLSKRTNSKNPKDSEFGDRNEKARKGVSDKINRTLTKIKEYDEKLHNHLKTYLIKEKSGLTYKPPQKIYWKI